MIAKGLRTGAFLLLVGVLGSCGHGTTEWFDGDGYRWRELHVPRRGGPGFTQLEPSRTGIEFANSVTERQLMQNRHLGQGSGVTLGDVDGDGLVDVYLGQIDGPNVLYRNLGDWRFEDVTARAGVAADDRFTTGVAFADVDADRDLDLLVLSLGGKNSLFLNDGTGVFTEQSEEAGLDSGFGSTTPTLADVDGDGDLDLYVADYRVLRIEDVYAPADRSFERTVRKVGGQWEVAPNFREYYRVRVREDLNVVVRTQLAEPDLFYLNDGGGRFERVPWTGGRFLDEEGKPLAAAPEYFNLSARFYDFDDDGDQDLYVPADFEDPDQVWINDGEGTFRAIPRLALRTTSNSAMAVDFSDIDRDGDTDIFEADMLSRDPRRRKTEKPTHTPLPKLAGKFDDRPQFMHNTLNLNRGDGTYAQIAEFGQVDASGWSWATFFLDVDLDGYEDILVLTGHTWDVMDFDVQNRIASGMARLDWRRERFLFPKLDLKNVIFRNKGDLTFEEVGEKWGFADEEDISHGPAMGDLDGDGDLDVVVNRLWLPAGVYRNDATAPRIAVRLVGNAPNTYGVGSKIQVLGGPVQRQQKEVTLGGLYLSSSDPMYTFATGEASDLTIVVNWHSGRTTEIQGAKPNRLYEIREPPRSESEARTVTANGSTPVQTWFTDISSELGHTHVDSMFNDFARQPMLHNTLSLLGPGITWYDVDADGDEDLLIPSGQGGRLAFFRNDNGRLREMSVQSSVTQYDQTTVLGVPGQDGRTVLLVGQSNYTAASERDAIAVPAVLGFDMGDNGGSARTIIPGSRNSIGPLALADYDGDGDLDLFVGGRVIPGAYPIAASSGLYLNEGGRFELDETNSAKLSSFGLVSSAVFSDVDVDGDPDLLLALEWGPVKLLTNEGGLFVEGEAGSVFDAYSSRWIGIATGDLNEDGRPDIVATSWGRNTRYKVSDARPLFLYYGDFDRDGRLDLVEAQFEEQRQAVFPLESFTRIKNAMPQVQQRIATYMDYANATIDDVFGPQVETAERVRATSFDHMLFLSSDGGFTASPLVSEAQFAPSSYAGIADFDGDGHEDLFLTQNLFTTEIETPRFDAGRGLVLKGDGTGHLLPIPGQVSGIEVYGDQRGAAYADYNGDGRLDLVVSQNAAASKLYRNDGTTPGIRVRLVGPPRNPHAIGAMVGLVYSGRRGPVREVQAGSGYWSQNGAVQVFGTNGTATGVWVRWPGGREVQVPIESGQAEVVVSISP
jgi:hypothetical protein